MKVFLNAGHAPNGNPDPGACGYGLRECDVARNVADLVVGYLTAAGVEVVGCLQSDSLEEVVDSSNNSDADVFISIHCNACNGTQTERRSGTSTEAAQVRHWHAASRTRLWMRSELWIVAQRVQSPVSTGCTF